MEGNHYIRTSCLISLCYIFDDFEKFNERLKKVIITNHYDIRNFTKRLWQVSTNKKNKLIKGKVESFYEENKVVIDTINEYSGIAEFINCYYNQEAEPNAQLDFFYKYILTHKEKLDEIIAVLIKLYHLGIYNIEFNETSDFTKEEYCVSKYDDSVTFLDNIVIVPTCFGIYYKSMASNYKIDVTYMGRRCSIELNSLCFDADKLPNSTDRNFLMNKILELVDAQQKTREALRESVNLGISLADLSSQAESTYRLINDLNGLTDKNELNEIMLRIRDDIDKLRSIGAQFDSQIVQECPSLTLDIIEKEQKRVLKRREDSTIHWC